MILGLVRALLSRRNGTAADTPAEHLKTELASRVAVALRDSGSGDNREICDPRTASRRECNSIARWLIARTTPENASALLLFGDFEPHVAEAIHYALERRLSRIGQHEAAITMARLFAEFAPDRPRYRYRYIRRCLLSRKLDAALAAWISTDKHRKLKLVHHGKLYRLATRTFSDRAQNRLLRSLFTSPPTLATAKLLVGIVLYGNASAEFVRTAFKCDTPKISLLERVIELSLRPGYAEKLCQFWTTQVTQLEFGEELCSLARAIVRHHSLSFHEAAGLAADVSVSPPALPGFSKHAIAKLLALVGPRSLESFGDSRARPPRILGTQDKVLVLSQGRLSQVVCQRLLSQTDFEILTFSWERAVLSQKITTVRSLVHEHTASRMGAARSSTNDLALPTRSDSTDNASSVSVDASPLPCVNETNEDQDVARYLHAVDMALKSFVATGEFNRGLVAITDHDYTAVLGTGVWVAQRFGLNVDVIVDVDSSRLRRILNSTIHRPNWQDGTSCTQNSARPSACSDELGLHRGAAVGPRPVDPLFRGDTLNSLANQWVTRDWLAALRTAVEQQATVTTQALQQAMNNAMRELHGPITSLLNEVEAEIQSQRKEMAAEAFRSAMALARDFVRLNYPESLATGNSWKEPSIRLREAERYTRTLESTWNKHFADVVAKNVLCVTDSIAMPRPQTGVACSNTYPNVAQQSLLADGENAYRVCIRSIRGRTTHEALHFLRDSGELFSLRPAAVVLQLGIVDCAPRVFGQYDVMALRAAAGVDVADRAIQLAKMHRSVLSGKPLDNVYVDPNKFRRNLLDMAALIRRSTSVEQVIVFTIVTPSKGAEKMKATGLSENIHHYNDIIRQTASRSGFELLDADTILWSAENPHQSFSSDNYHFNSKGHRLVGRELARLLCQ